MFNKDERNYRGLFVYSFMVKLTQSESKMDDYMIATNIYNIEKESIILISTFDK